jgi:hypothetical protein
MPCCIEATCEGRFGLTRGRPLPLRRGPSCSRIEARTDIPPTAETRPSSSVAATHTANLPKVSAASAHISPDPDVSEPKPHGASAVGWHPGLGLQLEDAAQS